MTYHISMFVKDNLEDQQTFSVNDDNKIQSVTKIDCMASESFAHKAYRAHVQCILELYRLHLYYTEKSSKNILQNCSFCVPLKKNRNSAMI